MTENDRRPHAFVITWFLHGQLGFLDFSYRLHALAKTYRLTLVCRAPLEAAEVMVPGAAVVVLTPVSSGLVGFLHYWLLVALYVRRRDAVLIVNLGSQLGALGNFRLGAPQATYWNEHLSHYLGRPRGPARWLGQALQWLQYRGARRADLVMPITQAHAEDLLARGCERHKTLLLPMGAADRFAPVSVRAPSSVDPQRLRLIYTGAVKEDRGRDVMIEALALAKQKGCPVGLTIVGADDEAMAICLERRRRFGLQAELELLPRVDGERIPSYLAQADFGLCLWADRLYYRFNAPTKLFEYLVAGLPVLASDIRTHTAYVRHQEHGYVFAYDAASLAQAMCEAWRDRARWPSLREAAAREGLQYRWSVIEPRFLGALRALHT